MQNPHNENEFDRWIEKTTNASNGKVTEVFENALRDLSKRASRCLNQATLLAVLNRVHYQCLEKFPILNNLKIDSTGLVFLDNTNQLDFDSIESEMVLALRYLFKELYQVLGKLTADVLTSTIVENQGSFFDLVGMDLEKDHDQFHWEDYDLTVKRLDVLYGISKYFANFESVEKTFPEIFQSLLNVISFKSVILLEKKDEKCFSTLWYDSSTPQVYINESVEHSKKFYQYLVCPKNVDCIRDASSKRFELPFCAYLNKIDEKEKNHRFITMPLTLSSFETFGVLQFECLSEITEADLRFINALSNLIALTLDRYNREQFAELERQSELKQKAMELNISHQHVNNLEKEKELRAQFVSTLTHDLRTPLTTAKMGAQYILRSPNNPDKSQQFALKILKSIDRMDQMIKDLLDANRIQAGETLELVMNYCDLKEIVTNTIRDLSTAYGERFLLECPPENILGFWNEDGLRRLVENLASNAVKYGHPEEPITIKIKTAGNFVEITVHNFGNPISPKEQTELFEPFHRCNSAKNVGKKGWGLGLTLVRGVAKAHGGSVRVKSNESEGTSFIVSLPTDARPYQLLN